MEQLLGSDTKLAACSTLAGGGIHCINYKEKNFADEVLMATHGRGLTLTYQMEQHQISVCYFVGVDVILDFIGASYWEKNLQSVAIDGRIVLLGLVGIALVWVCSNSLGAQPPFDS